VRVEPIEPDAAKFPHVAQLVSVERISTHKKTQEATTGCRYFGTSLRPIESTPQELGMKVRGYWGVENLVHWRRDVIGQEDQCRLRSPNAACVLALLRTALLAVVKAAGFASLKLAQEEFTSKPGSALRIIRNQRLASMD
jgi:predicted transposase YbfD/YdcC